jgi:hypothetical protein
MLDKCDDVELAFAMVCKLLTSENCRAALEWKAVCSQTPGERPCERVTETGGTYPVVDVATYIIVKDEREARGSIPQENNSYDTMLSVRHHLRVLLGFAKDLLHRKMGPALIYSLGNPFH